jgi:hypothetical protein
MPNSGVLHQYLSEPDPTTGRYWNISADCIFLLKYSWWLSVLYRNYYVQEYPYRMNILCWNITTDWILSGFFVEYPY